MGPPFAGPWSFRYHPWLRGIMDCPAELVVMQKGAQLGVTEAALNKVFHTIDYRRLDTMYVLPNKNPDAADFSSGRFGPALELSPHLRQLFTEADNVGHKRAGTANLYVRGSRSRAQLKSVPINFLVLDELDEMEQNNIPLAMERTSGQQSGTFSTWMLSTPTIESYGINLYFTRSTQNHFFFKCPGCSKMINLEYPRNLEVVGDDPHGPLIVQSRLFCHLCNVTINHEDKAAIYEKGTEWVAKTPGSSSEGFAISQLYSCASAGQPAKIAQKALLARSNPADEQELFNSTFGVPHVTDGSRVDDKSINECIGNYTLQRPSEVRRNNFLTMGVDVGKVLHVEIDDWYWDTFRGLDTNVGARCKVVALLKLHHFEELDALMRAFHIRYAVVDLNPERRKAREFVNRFYGYASTCEYPVGVNGRNIHENENEAAVQVDRTSWLDLALGRFHQPSTIALPQDTPQEYKDHIKALTRVYYRDNEGNARTRYVKGQQEDHFAHARNYSEVAFTLATMTAANMRISSPV